MVEVGDCDGFDVFGFFGDGANQIAIGVVGKDRRQGCRDIRGYR
jgi:hypothetical protein